MGTDPRPTRTALWALRAAIAPLGLVLLGACADSPLDPAAFAPEPCALLPAFALPAGMVAPSPASVNAALTDAADRLTRVFPAPARSQLEGALRQVAAGNGADRDARCRGLLVARSLLDGVDETPALQPDRAAIWLAVELAAAVLVP